MHSLIVRKDVLHPATSPPVLCFFQCSVFIPISLASLCSPSPGFWEETSGWSVWAPFGVHVWMCAAVCGNVRMLDNAMEMQRTRHAVFACGKFPSRDKGAKPDSVPWAPQCNSNYSGFLSWSVGIWRFIQRRGRKRRTDISGPIGVNLFSSLLLVKKNPSWKEGSALDSALATFC